MKIRKPAVAGMFYPMDKNELEGMIDDFLSNVPRIKLDGRLKALIVPHAGYIYSGKVAAYAYSLLGNYKKERLKIILLGPSHFAYLNDAAADPNDYWETPLGRVKVAENSFFKSEAAHSREHCLEVQVPFLQKVLKGFEILPIVAGDISPREASRKIFPLLDEKAILVISSDLSHYNDYSTAVKIDKNTISAIQSLNYEKLMEEGDACGKIPILTMTDIAKNSGWRCKLLDYKNSGDTYGQKNSVVGYASIAFYK